MVRTWVGKTHISLAFRGAFRAGFTQVVPKCAAMRGWVDTHGSTRIERLKKKREPRLIFTEIAV